MKIFLAFLCTCSFFLVPYSSSFNLRDLIKSTYSNNTAIKVHKKQLEVSLLQSSVITSEIFPRFSAELSLNSQYYDTSIIASPYKSQHLSLYLDQEIFSGGRTVIKLLQNNINVQKSYNKLNKSVNDIIYSAIESYQNIIFFRSKIQLKQENIDRYTAFLDTVVAKNRYGVSSQDELLYARARLANAKLDLLNDQGELEKNYQKFLAIVGIDPSDDFEIINLNTFKTFLDNKSFIHSTLLSNPELLSKRLDVETSHKNLLLKKSELLPTIALQLQHKVDLRGASFNQTPKDGLGITLILPILSKGGREYVDIYSHNKLLQVSQLDLQDTINIVSAESKNMWNAYVKYYKMMHELRLIKKYYYNAIKSLETKVFSGSIASTTLLDRQNQYNESIIQAIETEELGYKMIFFAMYRHLGVLPTILSSS